MQEGIAELRHFQADFQKKSIRNFLYQDILNENSIDLKEFSFYKHGNANSLAYFRSFSHIKYMCTYTVFGILSYVKKLDVFVFVFYCKATTNLHIRYVNY